MRPESHQHQYANHVDGIRGTTGAEVSPRTRASHSPEHVHVDSDAVTQTKDTTMDLQEASKDTEIKPMISDERSSSASSIR
jgi:hypothetical protein